MKAAALALLLLLAACQSQGGSWCDISSPIRLSDKAIDALSDEEVSAVLRHNSKGAALCKWEP
jgi:hypothetical protein